MKQMLNLQVTIFAVMAVGFILKRLNIISKQGRKELTDLVIYAVLPANIVSSFLSKFDSSMISDFIVILFVSIGIQIFSVFYGKLIFRKESDDRFRCLSYATICSNAGFLGNPIAEGVFGPIGLVLASVYLIPQRIMMWSEGIAIFSGAADKKATLRKVVTHPCVLACALGTVLMVFQVNVPSLILTPLQTIARCNTAMSMLVIGMILADIDLKNMVDKTIIVFTIHRLVIIPVIVMAVLLPLPVSRLVRGLSVLLVAMPAGATTSMLAAKYDKNPEFATKLVIFSTLCSIPAIMIWSMIVI